MDNGSKELCALFLLYRYVVSFLRCRQAVNTQTKLFHYYKRQPKVANKSSTIEVPTDLNKAGPESQSVTLGAFIVSRR